MQVNLVKEFFRSLWNTIRSRTFFLSIIFIGLFSILLVRVFQLQIVNGESYLNDYLYQSKRILDIDSTRGLIYDRNGKVLAYNELAYAVVITDDDTQNNRQINHTIYRTIGLIEKNGDILNNDFRIAIDENGNFIFTTLSEDAKLGFLRDAYGKRSISELDTEKEKLSKSTAEDVFLYLCSAKRFNIVNELSYSLMTEEEQKEVEEWKENYEDFQVYSNEDALKILSVRYELSFNSYQRYIPTKIASDVNTLTVAAIKEHMAELHGVSVEEETIRKYNDAIYFAHIIGYTGRVDSDTLKELQKENPDYSQNDIVGKSGIEEYMEVVLHGKKGKQTVYVDSVGSVLDIADVTQPVAGNDIYLTIDADLSIQLYHELERYLASILSIKIVNRDVPVKPDLSASNRYISIKDAYYALFNNNILDVTHFSAEDATETEQAVFTAYQNKRDQVITELSLELMNENASIYSALPEEYQVYMSYLYTMLADAGVLVTSRINTSDATFIAWRNDDAISLREFLGYAISQNWIDTSKLKLDSKYSDTEQVYLALVDYISERLVHDTGFSRKVYKYMIQNYTISPTQICTLLFDQNIITYNEEEYQSLQRGNSVTAYHFFMSKVVDLELTPAQLALDPCSGSICVVDPENGDVLAMVTYPSYDNNRLSGSIDAEYWSKLANDQSNAKPLINRATMTNTAPGSTYKPLSAIAGLEEGVVSITERIRTTGSYDRFKPEIHCWIYPGSHGTINITEAIRDSCNYYCNEIGYRLSLNSVGEYVPEYGLERLGKYAKMFGLGECTGIELTESLPEISTEDPLRSAMGQGNNNYTNIQLARYVMTLANSGYNYQLTLLEKRTDSEGNLIEQYDAKLARKVEIAESSWDVVHNGMRAVVTNGSIASIFRSFPIAVSGKTGTAQENAYRPNHAVFVGYAPSDQPEVAISVLIPNGYTSSYASEVAKNALSIYFGETKEQTENASTPNGAIVID